jgi:hypothetical protein
LRLQYALRTDLLEGGPELLIVLPGPHQVIADQVSLRHRNLSYQGT